jgi:hypothetical protein
MGTGAVIALGDRLDVWVEEEALVFVDFEDRAALAAEVTPTATTIAGRFRHPRPPVFGVGLSAALMAHGDSLAAHAGRRP